MLRRTLPPLLAGLFVALLTPVATAVWMEPQQSFPDGGTPPLTTGITPQTKTGLLTVNPGQLSASQPSTFLPTSGTPVPRGSITAFGGTASVTNAVAAGVYGTGASVTGGGLEVGVYGAAGVDSTAAVGVYGSSGAAVGGGYNPLAWAGYFSGASSIAGQLIVQGSAGTCSNDPAQPCSNHADCTPVSPSNVCNGSTHPRITVNGKSTFAGNPTASTPGTLAGYAVRLSAGSTIQYQGAAVGVVTASGSNAEGQGVVGRVNAGVSCGATSLCAGVYGSDGSTAYDVPGRWAGYFNGSVNVDGEVSLNGTLASISTDDPEPLYTNPPQFAHLPPGSILGSVSVGGANSLWGVAFDGQRVWAMGWGTTRTLARLDPASLTVEASCTLAQNGRGMVYDGRYLWTTPGTNVITRIDPFSITNGGTCNEATSVLTYGGLTYSTTTFGGPAVGSSTIGSTNASIWFCARIASGADTGTYLVEVDPATLALRGPGIKLSSVPSTPQGIMDDGTNVWISSVTSNVSGANVVYLARVRKSDASLTLFDYGPASCPVSSPGCITADINNYRGIVAGGGSVWVSSIEGVSGPNRLLRIDPAANQSVVQAVYPVGGSHALAYDGQYVWVGETTSPMTIFGVRAFDGQIVTANTNLTVSSIWPRQFTFDGTSVYATDFPGGRLIKFLR